MNILIVEKNPVALTMIKNLLCELGYDDLNITTLQNGQEAVDVCSTMTFDIIFLSSNAIGVNGKKVFKRLKTIQGDNTWFVAMTTDRSAKKDFRCTYAGFDDLLVRPF
jgi:DNA-binding response OmpR family regulator